MPTARGRPTPGRRHPTALSRDADLRTDLPRYRVFADGTLVDEPTDVTRYWRDDLVSFLLGCSFTFECALAAAGLPLAHQRQGVNVPMYVTDRRCVGAGPFEGPLVVSMRPFAPDGRRACGRDLVAASRRCTADRSISAIPRALGITDLDAPDFGDPVNITNGAVPVFWACGVTPQAVVIEAKPSLAIFHAPGHMFITDRPHAEFDSEEKRHDRP